MGFWIAFTEILSAFKKGQTKKKKGERGRLRVRVETGVHECSVHPLFIYCHVSFLRCRATGVLCLFWSVLSLFCENFNLIQFLDRMIIFNKIMFERIIKPLKNFRKLLEFETVIIVWVYKNILKIKLRIDKKWLK